MYMHGRSRTCSRSREMLEILGRVGFAARVAGFFSVVRCSVSSAILFDTPFLVIRYGFATEDTENSS